MEALFPDRIIVKVRATPILFRSKFRYCLSDFVYGEWIVFEKGVPKYYLNVFDEKYSQLRDRLMPDAERFLADQFIEKGLNLSIRESSFGVSLPSRSEIVEMSLEKLPLNYIV